MVTRRTPAPDMAACILLLCAVTLGFAILRSLYLAPSHGEALARAGAYGTTLLLCGHAARGLLRRRGFALPLSALLFVCLIGAGVLGGVPDTAQVPAGVLGVFGLLLLSGSHRELATA